MKVELQCGDTITIPEGCKAIVKNGSVVFEREKKEELTEEERKVIKGFLFSVYSGLRFSDIVQVTKQHVKNI